MSYTKDEIIGMALVELSWLWEHDIASRHTGSVMCVIVECEEVLGIPKEDRFSIRMERDHPAPSRSSHD